MKRSFKSTVNSHYNGSRNPRRMPAALWKPALTGALCRCAARAVLGLVIAATASFPAAAANVLTNSDFEAGNLGGWNTSGPNNYVQSGAAIAHNGSWYFKIYGQFNAANNYTAIYQIHPSLPGAIYSANGWGYSLSGDAIKGQDQAWIEVSFRDASYKALALYRSTVVTSNIIAGLGGFSTWFSLPVTNRCSYSDATALVLLPGTVTGTATSLVAPANTAYVFYQVVFAQGPDNANGSMYFDDLNLTQTGGTVVPSPALQWNIVWDDEFNGSSIDPAKWTFETGNNNGWGNRELEYYTSSSQNAYVSNGVLHIAALRQSINGYQYTSARMKTQNHYATTFGRVVWRAALPAGTGMWPALWMLGTSISSVGWPKCGEIDVVEENGSSPNRIQSSLHSGSDETGYYYFPGGQSATDFHVYMLDWGPYSIIRFYVDGNLFETQTGWYDAAGPYPTPFNAPHFLIMNLAVGGNYVGNPSTNDINAGTVFPAEMLVDYVRVYQQTLPLALAANMQPDGSVVLSWPANIVCHLQILTTSTGLSSGAGWTDVAGAPNPYVLFPDSNSQAVFFRLASP
jgi:beta-glucanase (GH16 family)